MIQAYFNIFAIFAMMFVGYFLSYKKWFDRHTADTFSKMVLGLALPFEMFITITQKFSRAEFFQLIGGIIVPILSMVLAYFASKVLAQLLNVDTQRRGTFSTMFTCSNTIFIGLPINMAIFVVKQYLMSLSTISPTQLFSGPGAFIRFPKILKLLQDSMISPKIWCYGRS
jgi:predicted permease